MTSVSGTRAVQNPAEFIAAATLLIDLNREYDCPMPEPDWLTVHLDTLVKSGDTSVLTFGSPAIGVTVLRFRIGTMSAALEVYLAEFYIRPGLRGKGYGTRFLDDVIEHARGRGATYGASTATRVAARDRRLSITNSSSNRAGSPDVLTLRYLLDEVSANPGVATAEQNEYDSQ